MADTKNIAVGKLGKPHGVNGAFRFYMHRELKNNKKQPKHFMVLQKGSMLPWFVSKIQWLAYNEGLILFEDITTPEQAKQFAGSELYLSEKDVSTYFKKDDEGFDYLTGYTAIDEETGVIGTVEEVIETPAQILLQVNRNGNEVLIPLVDDFVIEINEAEKEILLTLPEGLLDL